MLFNTWEWIRLCGFLAYVYFTFAVIFGLLRKSPPITKQKNLLFQLHLSAGWIGLLALILHALLLIVDHYQPYSLIEILVPFTSSYKPILSALGIISLYIFIVVLMTSDLWIGKMNKKIWKSIHFLVLPAWLLTFVHGVFIGSDIGNPMVQVLYIVTGIGVLFAGCIRIYRRNLQKSVL